MKKRMLILIAVLGVQCWGYSQDLSTPNNESFDFTVGYEKNGYLGRFNYNRNIGEKGKVKLGAQYNYETFNIDFADDLIIQLFLANIEYYYDVVNLNRGSLIISLGLGGAGGYEYINELHSDEFGIDAESKTVFGGHVGAEIDNYLLEINEKGNFLSLIINARHYYLANSELGNNQFNASVGVRYNF